MARMRTLKPEFFRSLTLCRVDRGIRLTFAGLWTECDDEGRMVWDPRLVKAALYPLDIAVTEAVVGDDVAQLARIGAVHLYTVKGREYLHIPSWHEHQHPNRSVSSKLPPCGGSDNTLHTHCFHSEDAVSPGNAGEQALTSARTANAVRTQGALTPVGVVVDVDVDVEADRTARAPRRKTTPIPDDFEITLAMRSWAKGRGITAALPVETEQWLDYHRARGSRFIDWQASWRTWMNNTLKWGGVGAPPAPPKPVNGW